MLDATRNFTPATALDSISNMASNMSTVSPSTGNTTTNQTRQTPSANAPIAPSYDRTVQQRLMGNIKQRLGESIPESGFQYKPYVFSESDFQMKMAAYLALNDRETPVDSLDDFPTDPEAQRYLVRQIVEAMLNMDKETLIDPQAKLPLARIKRLSPFELDLMAWKVLIETRDAHRGTISLPSWGKEWPWEEFSSFSERLKAVRSSLYHCKAMVSSLFDEVFAKRLPLNPTAELARKNSNKRLNGKRKQYLELAKVAKKDGFVPSNIRQTTNQPTPSTSRWSSGPESTRPVTQPVSSINPVYKRRKTDHREADVNQSFLDFEQSTDLLADRFEKPSSDQSLVTDDFDVPALGGIGRSTKESSFTQEYTPKTASTLESPFGTQTEQGIIEGVGVSNTTQRFLSVNDVHQWTNNTVAPSNQEMQQAIGISLGPGLFGKTQVNPTSSDRLSGQVNIPSQNDKFLTQRGQRPTSDCAIAQPFTETGRSTTTFSQRDTMPATSIPRKSHQASQQDSGTPIQQQLPPYLPDQGQAMYGNSLHTSIVDVPVSKQELEEFLNMPDNYDAELGVWKVDSGESVDFSRFDMPPF